MEQLCFFGKKGRFEYAFARNHWRARELLKPDFEIVPRRWPGTRHRRENDAIDLPPVGNEPQLRNFVSVFNNPKFCRLPPLTAHNICISKAFFISVNKIKMSTVFLLMLILILQNKIYSL